MKAVIAYSNGKPIITSNESGNVQLKMTNEGMKMVYVLAYDYRLNTPCILHLEDENVGKKLKCIIVDNCNNTCSLYINAIITDFEKHGAETTVSFTYDLKNIIDTSYGDLKTASLKHLSSLFLASAMSDSENG